MIRAFKEKPQPGETDSHLINAGIYLFEPSVLAHIPTGRPVSVERETYPALLASGCRMAVYHEEAYWRDLGTRRDYLAFTSDLLDEELPVFGGLSKMFYGVCKGVVTSPEATIIAPSYIAPGAVVKSHAVVGPYAVVEEGAVIGEGAEVDHAILWLGARLAPKTKARDAIVVADASIPAGEYAHAILTGKPEDEEQAG